MTPQDRYETLFDLFPDAGAASPTKGFGSAALKAGGKIFAMLVDEHLVVKLPRAAVDAYVSHNAGERFVNGGRVMKEWLVVASTTDWERLAHEAHEFVSG